MQLSTDLPHGIDGLRRHTQHRGETRLPMNVSKAADEVSHE